MDLSIGAVSFGNRRVKYALCGRPDIDAYSIALNKRDGDMIWNFKGTILCNANVRGLSSLIHEMSQCIFRY